MRPNPDIAGRWLPSLLLSLLATAALQAQESARPEAESRGTEWSLALGPHLSDDDTERFGTVRARVELGVEREFIERIDLRGVISLSLLGDPPCPPPPGEPGLWILEIGKSIEGHLDLVVPLRIGSRLSLEPFAGGGIRFLTRATTDDPSPTAFGISESLRPLVSGGATVSMGVAQRVRVFTRVRLSRHFMGSQTLEPVVGEPRVVEMKALDTASLTAGLALRF